MRRGLFALFAIVAALALTTLVLAQEPIYGHFAYLPVVTDSSPNPALGIDHIALLADAQNRRFTLQRQVVASLAARHNDILVMAGDVVCLSGCTDMQCADQRYEAQLEILEPLGSLEWHFSPGNHEYAAGVELGVTAWEKWIGDRYHNFDTTQACFFMIDDQVWDTEQAQWLNMAITQCDKPWRILVKHFPMPHSDEPNYDRNFERYTELDLDLIIAGHRHSFIVWRSGQMFNIVLPATTNSVLWSMAPYPVTADEVVTQFPVNCTGFGELEIGPETLTWRIYRWDGLLLLEGESVQEGD